LRQAIAWDPRDKETSEVYHSVGTVEEELEEIDRNALRLHL
jgi:hypothetical protein